MLRPLPKRSRLQLGTYEWVIMKAAVSGYRLEPSTPKVLVKETIRSIKVKVKSLVTIWCTNFKSSSSKVFCIKDVLQIL